MNVSTGSLAQSIFQMNAGDRYVNNTVDHTFQWVHEVGVGINTRYWDFQSFAFRNAGAVDLLVFDSSWFVIKTPNAQAPTPAVGDNSTAIATTAWARANNIGVGASAMAQHLFWAQPTATQTIGQYTPIKVNLGFEQADKSGAFSTVTSRFTAPAAGWYQFTASVGVDTGGAVFLHSAQVVKNGDVANQAWKSEDYVGAADHAVTNLTVFLPMGVGDYAEMFYWHTYIGGLTFSQNPYDTYFQGHYLGPL
jgi:hypothetical protein